ncbi:MAG: ATP-binding cassette domain-containing protein, partial [Rubrivivax sp.]|nr:ATP-binding cassette domain-containing protein [Rubrivivax sp.]
MAPLLQTDALTVTYSSRGGNVVAVQDTSIVVREGESVALVGESGSGKSTVARAMLGLLPEGIAAIPSGRILL